MSSTRSGLLSDESEGAPPDSTLGSTLGDTELDLVSSDLTLSHHDEKHNKGGTRKYGSEVERKQLLHDIQLLRIELSQKSLIIDNLKADHMNKVEELEEKLHDALHKKQMYHARLESAISIQQDEAKKHQLSTQKELQIILDRQLELEETNKRLQMKSSNIRQQLERDCIVTEDVYINLKSQPEDNLTIADYFSLRLFEGMQPLQIECGSLRTQRDKLSSDIAQLSHSIHNYEQQLMQEQRQRSHAEIEAQSLKNELGQVRKLLDERTGKAQRFDTVNDERNRLDEIHTDLVKKNSYLEAEHSSLTKQFAHLKTEKDTLQQNLQLLKQDKEYLTRNLTETSLKLQTTSDTLQRTQQQLEQIKTVREELYEKYAASREEARVTYERRLQTELDRIRLQTEHEIEKLRTDSKEAYERENRNLREARDLAIDERDQLMKVRDDAEKRCELYKEELRTLESSLESRISDYQNEARVKTFELDRLQLIHEETCKNLNKCQSDNERISRKYEVISLEHSELQRKTAASEAQLQTTNRDLQSRLETYEKIEKEMDDIVLQAAEVQDDDDDNCNQAERVLFSYGYGANVPSNAKRRMKQSVQLARRVLQLEKINTSLHKEIQKRQEEAQEISKKLSQSERLLDESRQPYSYMVDSMRKRDHEIDQQRLKLSDLQTNLDKLTLENGKLRETKRLLSSDLDRLLNHRQEMSVIKKVLINAISPRHDDVSAIDDVNLLQSLDSQPAAPPISTKMPPSTAAVGQPAPVIFTKNSECPVINKERYSKISELLNE